MSDLATGKDDKYIGKNNKPESEPRRESIPTPKKDPVKNNGNRTRKVKYNATTKGYGKKQRYDYHDGVRTALVEDGGKLYKDENGNLAQVGHSSLFKKRFEYIEGLPKEVNAKVIDGKIEGSNDNQKIVQVKDKDKNVTYYRVNTTDNNKYQLGEQLIKNKNTFTLKKQNNNKLSANNTERQKMEVEAKKKGYTPIKGAEYGWYTKKVNKKVQYFKWNPEEGKFEIKNNVTRVNKKWKYETK